MGGGGWWWVVVVLNVDLVINFGYSLALGQAKQNVGPNHDLPLGFRLKTHIFNLKLDPSIQKKQFLFKLGLKGPDDLFIVFCLLSTATSTNSNLSNNIWGHQIDKSGIICVVYIATNSFI